jgi:hypothetical protein
MREAFDRLYEKLQADFAAAETRAAVAETEVRLLREALAEARRPWWRRLMGNVRS